MKTEIKDKIIAEYISQRNRRAGLALKQQRGVEYYRELGKKGGKAKAAAMKLKAVDN